MAKKLAQIKTKETTASVEDFLNTVTDAQKRKDCSAIVKMMEKATKSKAKLWGSAIIGFGNLIYESPKTGRQQHAQSGLELLVRRAFGWCLMKLVLGPPLRQMSRRQRGRASSKRCFLRKAKLVGWPL